MKQEIQEWHPGLVGTLSKRPSRGLWLALVSSLAILRKLLPPCVCKINFHLHRTHWHPRQVGNRRTQNCNATWINLSLLITRSPPLEGKKKVQSLAKAYIKQPFSNCKFKSSWLSCILTGNCILQKIMYTFWWPGQWLLESESLRDSQIYMLKPNLQS